MIGHTAFSMDSLDLWRYPKIPEFQSALPHLQTSSVVWSVTLFSRYPCQKATCISAVVVGETSSMKMGNFGFLSFGMGSGLHKTKFVFPTAKPVTKLLTGGGRKGLQTCFVFIVIKLSIPHAVHIEWQWASFFFSEK